MGFIRKLYGAFSRKADKITLFQVKAMEKADRISKGEKMPAPLYPSEEKILKRLAKDDERIKQIREKIDKKDETLIGNVEEITITSTDPLEHSKSKRKRIMVYGTPFEQLEDEEKTAITKRPKGIQDEIVTDERGKRRFHGAFTGGFSAGYFNTVGTKHGWVPQTFKSSREDRAEKMDQSAQDFMDDEDLGEFGIAARKIRTRVDFMDSLAAPGEKRMLAWERSATTTSAPAGDDGSLAHKLTGMLRPINDSIGVRLLKKMGWRPGKGVGEKMTRRALERQKVIDAKSRGKNVEFDEDAVKEVEGHVSGAEFAPDDISMFEIKPKEDVHGLAYKPLQDSGVLSEKYGIRVSALKTTQRSKGIRGQAFGVGAFEEEDDDIYTNYDLSQYDFEVGASTSTGQKEIPRFDSTFVPATTSSTSSRKYFSAPMPLPGWRPNPNRTKSILDRKAPHKLSDAIIKVSERLTPFQRAKLLGERDHSVMEMLSSADREKFKQLGGKKEKDERREEEMRKRRRNEAEPFEEEPMKAHRFRQFVAYLKRGIPFPQPMDMTRLEWEKEQAQFHEALTPELHALLPEVRDRQKPLAKVLFAAPIAEHLKSRFERESGAEIKYEQNAVSKDPKIDAVRNKQFGAITRQKHEWHPAKDLCKRFNVTNPYPDSHITGVPGLSRSSQKGYAAEYALLDFGSGLRDTASELHKRQHSSRFDQRPSEGATEKSKKEVKNEPGEIQIVDEEKKQENNYLAPMDLLAAIFGVEDEEDELVDEEEEEAALIRLPGKNKPLEPRKDTESVPGTSREQTAVEKRPVVTVLDLVEDDGVYGPPMPQEYSAKINNGTNGNGGPADVVTVEDDSEEESSSSEEEEEDRHRKRRKAKKMKKKHTKKKKHRHHHHKVKREKEK